MDPEQDGVPNSKDENAAAPNAAALIKPVEMGAGDFNSDGRLDLALTTRDGDTFSATLLLNNGDGTFERLDAPNPTAGDLGVEVLSLETWYPAGSSDIDELKREVPGLSFALENLPTTTIASLFPGGVRFRSYTQCADNYACFWENNAYTGAFYALWSGYDSKTLGWFNDKMTSWWNRTRCYYEVFVDSCYAGNSYWPLLASGSESAVEPWFNDQMSSVRSGSAACEAHDNPC